MPSRFQKTICSACTLDGIGLHTGQNSTLTLKPADINNGIIFRRVDLQDSPTVPADINFVVETNRGTVLEKEGVRIYTVEHVLSAFHGLGINNVVIELSGPEPPIMDGSALPFVNAINNVGIVEQDEPIDAFHLNEPIRYTDDANKIEMDALPAEQFKITFMMDYESADFPLQYTVIDNVESNYTEEIAPARTFGLLSEIVQLKENGLIKGGGLHNAVVVVDKKVTEHEQKKISKLFNQNIDFSFDNGSILNTEGLRFENESVRHKVLDLIGDLALLGKPMVGHIIATRSGHKANIELVRRLIKMV